MCLVSLGNDWDGLLAQEFEQDYYKRLRRFLVQEYKTHTIYPDMHDIFNALKYTAYAETRVVILGQDPYHGPNQAHGLCFSVQDGVPAPRSLQNIFKEIHTDIGTVPPNSGNLARWATQGVLLLNTVLTVREANPNSHKGMGWETFTDRVISLLNEREKPVVFLLWGANARAKSALLTNPSHLILACAHPSPLSQSGFFGCRHFSKTNEFLEKTGQPPIVW